MHIYENKRYIKEISDFAESLDLSYFNHKTILIAGACGLVMSYLIDTLLADTLLNVNIIALIYSDADKTRFFGNDKRMKYIQGDVKNPHTFDGLDCPIDIVINGASIVDPKGYKEKPIDTMLINIYGTKNLLDVASKHNSTFLLTSSCEIYGEADVEMISENYCGKLDTMDVRSCYNESKRACETLSVSYAVEKGVRSLIARLSRTFGPTQSPKDTKALSQFMKNAALDEDIVLKSSGTQLFSYTYVQDVVSGLLQILEKGETCNAYNVCNRERLKLKDIASICSSYNNKKVVFDLKDDEYAKTGYSKASLAVQDPTKLEKLGWSAKVKIEDGIFNTIQILKELYFAKS